MNVNKHIKNTTLIVAKNHVSVQITNQTVLNIVYNTIHSNQQARRIVGFVFLLHYSKNTLNAQTIV